MATQDFLTPNEARSALQLGEADSLVETILPHYVTAVSELLIDRVGPVVYSTITGELHDGGGSMIYLDEPPIRSVSQVVEYESTTGGTLTEETNSLKPADGYMHDLNGGWVRRRSGGADGLFPVGRDNVRVSYVAGRYTSTTTVGSQFKLAAILTLKNAWRAQENSTATLGEFDVPAGNFPRFSVPNSVKDLLAREWRAVEF